MLCRIQQVCMMASHLFGCFFSRRFIFHKINEKKPVKSKIMYNMKKIRPLKSEYVMSSLSFTAFILQMTNDVYQLKIQIQYIKTSNQVTI